MWDLPYSLQDDKTEEKGEDEIDIIKGDANDHLLTLEIKWRACKTGEALKAGYFILPDSFCFTAMCAKNLLFPTPAISQTSAAVLSEFSYKILAFSNSAGSA